MSTSAYSRYYLARNITEHLVKENKYNRAATQKALGERSVILGISME
jgi:hypothetical protein